MINTINSFFNRKSKIKILKIVTIVAVSSPYFRQYTNKDNNYSNISIPYPGESGMCCGILIPGCVEISAQCMHINGSRS